MYRINHYTAWHIDQWNHRNLVTGGEQYSNDYLYLYTSSRTVCNDNDTDGNCDTTNHTAVRCDTCSMYRINHYTAWHIDQWNHRNLVTGGEQYSNDYFCLLYTSDAADERSSVDLG